MQCFSKEISQDVIENILSWLSVSDLAKASLVCREWKHMISSSQYFMRAWSSNHKSRPWLIAVQNKNVLHAFDPWCSEWRRIFESEDLMIHPGHGESDFLLYSVGGPRVKYWINLRHEPWSYCSGMWWWREESMVCYLPSKIFIVSPLSGSTDMRCANIMHVESGMWEMCDVLPSSIHRIHFQGTEEQARGSYPGLCPLSCVVLDVDKLVLVAGAWTGHFAAFRLRTKSWGRVYKFSVFPSVGIDVGRRGGIYLLCWRNDNRCVLFGGVVVEGGEVSGRVWMMKGFQEECVEIGRMPREMLEWVWGNEHYAKGKGRVVCQGMGDLVYFCNDVNGRACFCETKNDAINKVACSNWKIIPSPWLHHPAQESSKSVFKYGCCNLPIDHLKL